MARDVRRTCLCPCDDIISLDLWWQNVLCSWRLGRGIKGYDSWLCSKLTSTIRSHESKSETLCGSFGFTTQTDWHCYQLQERRIQPASWLDLSDKKKDFNWKSLRKNTHSLPIYFGLAAWITVSQLQTQTLFSAVIPLRQSQALCAKDIHGKTSRGCWDHPP